MNLETHIQVGDMGSLFGEAQRQCNSMFIDGRCMIPLDHEKMFRIEHEKRH